MQGKGMLQQDNEDGRPAKRQRTHEQASMEEGDEPAGMLYHNAYNLQQC